MYTYGLNIGLILEYTGLYIGLILKKYRSLLINSKLEPHGSQPLVLFEFVVQFFVMAGTATTPYYTQTEHSRHAHRWK